MCRVGRDRPAPVAAFQRADPNANASAITPTMAAAADQHERATAQDGTVGSKGLSDIRRSWIGAVARRDGPYHSTIDRFAYGRT